MKMGFCTYFYKLG